MSIEELEKELIQDEEDVKRFKRIKQELSQEEYRSFLVMVYETMSSIEIIVN